MIVQLFASFAPLALALTQGVGTRPGQLYPDLELPVVNGSQALPGDLKGAQKLRLSSLRGQRVLLIEFASW